MSFYLGKNTSGDAVLAISRAHDTAATLADASNKANLAFHSNYSYLNITEYTVVVNKDTSAGFSFSRTHDVFKIAVPSTLFKVAGTPRMFIILFGASISPVTCYTHSTYTATHLNDILYNIAHPCYNYTDDTVLLVTPTTGTPSTEIRFILFDLDFKGNVINNVFTSNSISVSTSAFLVRGIDYFSTKWLVTPAINNIDRMITLFGTTFQIVNSVYTPGPVSIAVSGSQTAIRKGGKLVLDSSGSFQTMAYRTSSFALSDNIRFTFTPSNIRTVPTTGVLAGLFFHGLYSAYGPYYNPAAALSYGAVIWYNPTQDTGYIPVLPENGYPGHSGGVCFGSLMLRINNGIVSIILVNHTCTLGTVPDPTFMFAGPYQVATTYVTVV